MPNPPEPWTPPEDEWFLQHDAKYLPGELQGNTARITDAVDYLPELHVRLFGRH